jgi:UDP-2,3-diacylglucosamine pyrophosphatase LpxH
MAIPLRDIPRFDELYVISDLHLGGAKDFQIFNADKEAAWLIDDLRQREPAKKIALLINGDLVDFLAERPALPFDPFCAVDKLDRISRDPAFEPVWTALCRFAQTSSRTLVINLGNHDLELALPWVRAHLLKILTGGDEAAAARIVLTFEGSGFLCRVGAAKILCVHGNEVDDWNVTDHEKIRRIGRDLLQGRPVESWIPNAGTQLVVDVMNCLKAKYPFVDLLKPEIEAVVPTLLALAPDQGDKVQAIAATVRHLAWDSFRRATGLLGVGDEPGAAVEPMAFGATGGLRTEKERQQYAQALLRAAEERLRGEEPADPMSLIPSDQQGGYLGTVGAIRRFFRGESTSEVLREALEELGKDRSFDLDFADGPFNRLDERMGDADFLVAGHTHLERALRRRKRNGWYLNTGTWVRLIRLEKDVLADKAKFEKVFTTLSSGTISDLDKELVLQRLTVAAFRENGSHTLAELRRVDLKKAKPLSTVFKTQG